jgi:hypothetical protein
MTQSGRGLVFRLTRRYLLRSVSPYRICTGTTGDLPSCIRGKPSAHSCFKEFDITRGHGGDRLANGRSERAGHPIIFEVCEVRCTVISRVSISEGMRPHRWNDADTASFPK